MGDVCKRTELVLKQQKAVGGEVAQPLMATRVWRS
jgi:hypothetical protein